LINAATSQAHREIKKATGGGAHVVMVTSGSRAAYEMALRSIRKAGTLAIVGMAPEPVPLSTVAMVSGEFRIVGSAVGSRQELREVLQLAAEGKLKCRIERHRLPEIDGIFEEMKNGRIVGRVVLEF